MVAVEPRHVLIFASVVEVCTGVGFIIEPALLLSLLLGMEASAAATLIARFFGIALLALGMGCWPGRRHGAFGAPILAMLVYNLMVAAYLAYLGTFGQMWGILLWPGVVLHAVVAALLVVSSYHGQRTLES